MSFIGITLKLNPIPFTQAAVEAQHILCFRFYAVAHALASIIIISLHSYNSVAFYRRRNAWLMLGYLCPFVGKLIETSINIFNVEEVTLMLVPASIFMAIAMFRYQAMDIVPLAQKMVFDSVPSAVVVIDPAMAVVAKNRSATILWPNDAQGTSNLTNIIHNLDTTGLVHGAEIEYQAKNHGRWFLVIVAELASAREGNLGYSLVFVDITDRKHKEIENQHFMDARAKFFASVSHELRSPLHATRGLLDRTLTSSLSKQQRSDLLDARASSDMLLALINNVLEESRLQVNMMTVEKIPMRLEDIKAQLQAVHAYTAEHEGLDLRFNVEDLDTGILGDPLRLTQVLTNLIANAIKYTDSGWISVDIRVLNHTDHRVTFNFSVTDTGIGISADDKASLFQPYHQGEFVAAHNFGGTGLGLTIAQALVQQMGGEINVESKPGEGSCFSFTLAFDTTPLIPSRQHAQSSIPDLSDYHLLVVDDSEINLDVLASQLQPTRATWDSATNGQSALAHVAQKRYDLVLLDVHMPNMNGLEAVTHIKQLEAYTHVPVIAMSASVLPEDRQRAVEAGFDGFLDKPFTAQELTNVLRQYLLHDVMTDATNNAPTHVTQDTDQSVVAYDKGVASLNGNTERYLALLSALANDCADQLNALNRSEDPAQQHQILHRLIGAAQLLSAQGLAHAASQLDTSITSGADQVVINQHLDELRQQNQTLKAWVAETTG